LPDNRSHRGPDPRDAEAFAADALPRLRQAVADYSWLLERGYAQPSALKLVGDRWSLTERQRMAVMRCACSDSARARRAAHRAAPGVLAGRTLLLDGFNVVTTIEAALGGGVVLRGRDDCDRDLAGVHGTYRKVEETAPALHLVAETLLALAVGRAVWLLDSPVSNSGRLGGMIRRMAESARLDCDVELVLNPDPRLAGSLEIVATADSAVLDRCERWFNLARTVVESRIPQARLVDLSCGTVDLENRPIQP
jgi:hypothetical protein